MSICLTPGHYVYCNQPLLFYGFEDIGLICKILHLEINLD